MTTDSLTERAAEAQDSFKDSILTISGRLLDQYVAETSGTTFGCDYEGDFDPRFEEPRNDETAVPSGTWLLGRNDADATGEVDYILRKHEQTGRSREEETHYLYGKYGWPNYFSDFVTETELYRDLIVDAVDSGFLSEEDVAQFDAAQEQFEDELESIRRDASLELVAEKLRENDSETLRPLLVNDDVDGQTIWQLLFSKDENGDVVENDVQVEVVSEADSLLMAKAQRQYHNDDGSVSHYPVGVVIGYDDTPEVFFVHRLRNHNGSPLRDEETQWTPSLVKQEMGFDLNTSDIVGETVPTDSIVRLQGDLTVRRHDYQTALDEYTEARYDGMLDHIYNVRSDFNDVDLSGKDYDTFAQGFAADHPVLSPDTVHSQRAGFKKVSISKRRLSRDCVKVPEDTEKLKTLQEELQIKEERVREAFDTLEAHKDCSRLTAQRRRDILNHLIQKDVEQWMFEECDATPSREEFEQSVKETAEEEFTDTDKQVNEVFGNHTTVFGPALSHPKPRLFTEDSDRQSLRYFVVPDEATLYVWHDEHENKQLTLGAGVYEFRFLDGHETGWWTPF